MLIPLTSVVAIHFSIDCLAVLMLSSLLMFQLRTVGVHQQWHVRDRRSHAYSSDGEQALLATHVLASD